MFIEHDIIDIGGISKLRCIDLLKKLELTKYLIIKKDKISVLFMHHPLYSRPIVKQTHIYSRIWFKAIQCLQVTFSLLIRPKYHFKYKIY